MNLAIKAQESMPNGGRLEIKTRNVFLDEEYSRAHVGVKPGKYSMMSVSDTGRDSMSENARGYLNRFSLRKKEDRYEAKVLDFLSSEA